MKYKDLAVAVGGLLDELGVRAYCREVCGGLCCRDQENRCKCTAYMDKGVNYCNSHLACSTYVCSRLLENVAGVAPHLVTAIKVMENKIRITIENYLADGGEVRPSAYFSDYDPQSVANLEIPTSVPLISGGGVSAAIIAEAADMRAILLRCVTEHSDVRAGGFSTLDECGSFESDKYYSRLFLDDRGRKFLIAEFKATGGQYGFHGPVSKDYPFECPELMPYFRQRPHCFGSWDEAIEFLSQNI